MIGEEKDISSAEYNMDNDLRMWKCTLCSESRKSLVVGNDLEREGEAKREGLFMPY
jgi:hypothetical protein